MTHQTPRYTGWKAGISFTALSLLTLTGCSDSDGGGNDGLRTGTLFTQGIENIHYETRSQSGTTDEAGEFRFRPGETLTFRVGNLVLADDIPAAPFLSPIDFTANARTRLHKGGADEGEDLTTHRTTEVALANNNAVAINITRLLTALAEQENVRSSDETLEITERTIDQLNDYLADDSNPEIDFSTTVEAFARPENISEENRDKAGDLANPSPANQLLDNICFAAKGSELCEKPPVDGPNNELSEEQSDKRSRILNARRTLDEAPANNAIDFLESETLDFRNDLATAFYLEPETLTLDPSDGRIKEVAIRRTGSSGYSLKRLDAITKGKGWAIHGVNRQEGTVEFYRNTSQPAEDGTIVLSFKVDYPDFDNYRWFRKNLLVEIN
ncbi:hypothetical protein [Salicola sp. Rm-C-2C1-2]|uniref:hypothetical protein n=1 Tax=Salicola sp. Rm-C-2C1-2 TaxID=3141321 RepID=UPI0032E3C621